MVLQKLVCFGILAVLVTVAMNVVTLVSVIKLAHGDAQDRDSRINAAAEVATNK